MKVKEFLKKTQGILEKTQGILQKTQGILQKTQGTGGLRLAHPPKKVSKQKAWCLDVLPITVSETLHEL